jgi:hypothetical protein
MLMPFRTALGVIVILWCCTLGGAVAQALELVETALNWPRGILSLSWMVFTVYSALNWVDGVAPEEMEW